MRHSLTVIAGVFLLGTAAIAQGPYIGPGVKATAFLQATSAPSGACTANSVAWFGGNYYGCVGGTWAQFSAGSSGTGVTTAGLTSGVIPVATGASTAGNSHIDDGLTTSGVVTISEPAAAPLLLNTQTSLSSQVEICHGFLAPTTATGTLWSCTIPAGLMTATGSATIDLWAYINGGSQAVTTTWGGNVVATNTASYAHLRIVITNKGSLAGQNATGSLCTMSSPPSAGTFTACSSFQLGPSVESVNSANSIVVGQTLAAGSTTAVTVYSYAVWVKP